MTPDEQELFNRVPPKGDWITNYALMGQLGWEADRYWTVRNSLIDQNKLERGRGRGGRVRRILTQQEQIAEPPAPEMQNAVNEHSLYAPVAAVLENEWKKEKRLEHERCIVHITARQGRRDTGGTWSRPDLVMVTQTVYPLVPGRHFDVITFEVKTSYALDLTAVYEALAHLRAATKAYVMFHIPPDRRGDLEEQLDEICAEARKHGIGVITFETPGDFSSWDELVEPTRKEPDLGRLNEFLTTQLDEGRRQTLLKWFR